MRQIPPVLRISVVLNVLTRYRVGKSYVRWIAIWVHDGSDAILVEEAGHDLAASSFDGFYSFAGGTGDGDFYGSFEDLFALLGYQHVYWGLSIWGGLIWCTRASSFTPSLIPCRHLVSTSSLRVMGLAGSIRPWSIQLCNLSRFSGDMSRAKLLVRHSV